MFALRPLSREHPVNPRTIFAAPLVLAACGGGPAASGAAGPAPSAEQAVRSFMQAAADSNLKRMAQLWGTRAGSASKTGQPPDYERRLSIMQIYLSGAPYRLVPASAAQVEQAAGDTLRPGDGAGTTRQVVVQLERPGCIKFVPFAVVKAQDNAWVVNQVDLAAAGHPKRPCISDKTSKDST
jgi:hypothetical protein